MGNPGCLERFQSQGNRMKAEEVLKEKKRFKARFEQEEKTKSIKKLKNLDIILNSWVEMQRNSILQRTNYLRWLLIYIFLVVAHETLQINDDDTLKAEVNCILWNHSIKSTRLYVCQLMYLSERLAAYYDSNSSETSHDTTFKSLKTAHRLCDRYNRVSDQCWLLSVLNQFKFKSDVMDESMNEMNYVILQSRCKNPRCSLLFRDESDLSISTKT